MASIGAALGLYFVVRGWLTALTLALALFCLVQCVIHRSAIARMLRDRRCALMVAALAAPLAAVLLAQAAHGELVPRYFDGPLRLLLAGLIFLHLASRRLDLLRVAEYAFPAAIYVCAAWIYLIPGSDAYFWGADRFATYFMDPLTLSQHIMIAGFCCLFLLNATRRDSLPMLAWKLGAFAVMLTIALGTQSRTGWLMAPLLILLWLIAQRGRLGLKKMGFALATVTAGCALVYLASPVVQARLDLGIQDVLVYLDGGDRDTSIGIRLSLYRANWILFLERPWTGWGYSRMPDLASIPAISSFYTPVLNDYFVRSGGHNEFLQSMMRMGVAGLISRLLLLGIPLYLFASAARSMNPRRRISGLLGLVVVIGYATAGLSSEVFNLIYAASFYALLVAMFAAGALERTHEH